MTKNYSTEDRTMTKRSISFAAAALAVISIAGCYDPEETGPRSGPADDAGIVPTSDGGPVPTACESAPATRDQDGDSYCPAGHDANSDGDCCDSGEALDPNAGDCNDDARAISPGTAENPESGNCGNGVDEDCGESPCATPGSCPDPDTLDPDCNPAASECVRDVECATGAFCLVDAHCTDHRCFTGVPRDCSDGDGTTLDSCNESADRCDHAVDAECVSGAVRSCTTSCSGDAGSQTCVGGHWPTACSAPAERCGNSHDDDCDGAVDEDCTVPVRCTPGEVQFCPAICGVFGSQRCADDGLSWGACMPPQEDCGNLYDDDCDGVVDDGCMRFYRDADGDTYGAPTGSVSAMSAPPGYVSRDGDCDDARSGVNPGASESCSTSFDDDCDGTVNEGCAPTGVCTSGATRSCYGGPAGTSGVGLCRSGTETCILSGGSYVWGACAGEVRPIAEVCTTSGDDDCDGSVNEGCVTTTYYLDADHDGYGRNDVTRTTPATDYVTVTGDCNDSNASVHPGAADVCPSDGLDNDCSGGDMTACGVSCTMTDTVRVSVGSPGSSSYDISYNMEAGTCSREYREINDASAPIETSVSSRDGLYMVQIQQTSSGQWFSYMETSTPFSPIFLRSGWGVVIQINGSTCTLPSIPSGGYTPPTTLAPGACEPCYDSSGWPNVCVNTSSSTRELRCNDGVDNDGDGRNDAADEDCGRWS
ncbi:hypothetical protein EPO33_02845 [Patescibacteria group bacterium]|nr:MAG: hypothetical protein EPO33_02845 [Patescibacteria group bacterium]